MIIAGSNGGSIGTGAGAVATTEPDEQPAITGERQPLAAERPALAAERPALAAERPAVETELGVIQLLLARERRRMAADVHDLIMQDLALALANAHALGEEPSDRARASLVVGALERALAGARDVLGGLSAGERQPIAQAVEGGARLAARSTPLSFRAAGVSRAARPDAQTREALVHIAREAVTNAVKHARPSEIEVVLEHDDGWRLTVRDDGCGFAEQPPELELGGFGLASMRESAHALGGAVHIGSAGGGGTTVEAVLP